MTLIKVKIAKGVLYLTREEMKQRAEALRKRIRKLKAAYEQQPLVWYVKEIREAQEEEARLKCSN